jgi:hypothetical protein
MGHAGSKEDKRDKGNQKIDFFWGIRYNRLRGLRIMVPGPWEAGRAGVAGHIPFLEGKP